MENELVNKQDICTSLVQRAIDRIIGLTEGKVKAWWAQHRNTQSGAFRTYLERKYS